MRPSVFIVLAVLAAGCMGGTQEATRAEAARACAVPDGCSGLDAKARDQCILEAAVDCGGRDLCGRIEDREAEYRCLMKFGEYDLILCAGIENQSVREECFVYGAELKKDPAICDKIGKQDSQDMCRADLAYKFGNRTICNDVKHFERREFCFAVADKDGTICGNLINSDLRLMCVEWTMKKLPR